MVATITLPAAIPGSGIGKLITVMSQTRKLLGSRKFSLTQEFPG
jgi:hypothetical protein